jgi:hypothetical protein
MSVEICACPHTYHEKFVCTQSRPSGMFEQSESPTQAASGFARNCQAARCSMTKFMQMTIRRKKKRWSQNPGSSREGSASFIPRGPNPFACFQGASLFGATAGWLVRLRVAIGVFYSPPRQNMPTPPSQFCALNFLTSKGIMGIATATVIRVMPRME